ncbi:MAG: MFS transporter [Candidatus Acidiferrum sp.]
MLSQNSSGRLLTIAVVLGFVVTGIATTALDPILPVFIARWSLDDAQAGFFFTTQFLGCVVGVLLSSVLLSSRGYRFTLILGYALLAVGTAGLNLSNQHFVLAATAFYGAGFGFVAPASNLCIAEQAGSKRASALSLLNLSWSVGSLFCPMVVLYGVRTGHLAYFLAIISLALCAASLVFFFVRGPYESAEITDSNLNFRGKSTSLSDFLLLVLLFLVYSGTESGVAGWVAAFAKRLEGASANAWELAPMFFWGGLLLGRLAGPATLHRIKEKEMALFGLFTAAIAIGVLIRAHERLAVMSAIFVSGLGLSLLFPIFVAWFSHRYGVRARRLGGIMFAVCSLGGALIPWSVGMVSLHTAGLRMGLVVPLAGCVFMFVIVAIFPRQATN